MDISDTQDGVLAIMAFADVINNPEMGLKCFTCIALAVDYGSTFRKYSIKERHLAAMRFITGSVNTYNWNHPLIMEACYVYNELQFNEDLEEIRILKQMRLEKLDELRGASEFGERQRILSEIKRIKDDQKRYSDSDFNNLLEESEAKAGGYKLSRLEQKQKNKNTFYHDRRTKRSSEPEPGAGAPPKSPGEITGKGKTGNDAGGESAGVG